MELKSLLMYYAHILSAAGDRNVPFQNNSTNHGAEQNFYQHKIINTQRHYSPLR